MYYPEQRERAVEPCIRHGLKATATIRELGYPSRAQLASRHREWQENGGRLTDRSLEQCTPEQKRAAARHYPAHGRRNALARREPGYPKCTAKLAERADGHAPDERRSMQLRVLGAPEGGRRRQGPGISGIVRPGGRRPGRMHEKRTLQVEARAAQEGAPMPEGRPSKPERTRGRPPATQAYSVK